MSPSMIKEGAARLIGAVVMLVVAAGASWAAENETLQIPVGHAQVVTSDATVKTVAIAEPKIADAAVGSERTVVVNGKSVGSTSLVVYGDGGRFTVYDVEVFTPNADKQVSLHVRVAEIDDRAKKELGFDFGGSGKVDVSGRTDYLTGGLFTTKVSSPSLPLSIGPRTDGAFEYERGDGMFLFQTTWRALEENGDIRVLANPTLVAKSGEKASFHAGGEFPVPIASAGGGTNAITVTIEWKEFGVKVDFLPTVEADGGITLQVAPEVSQLDFTTPVVLNGFVVPSVVTRKTSTTVHLNSGEHLVIGGLKQTEKSKTVRKVPVLGSIPLLGFFFSTTLDESLDRELMVVVSPEMLTAASNVLPKLPTDTPPPKK